MTGLPTSVEATEMLLADQARRRMPNPPPCAHEVAGSTSGGREFCRHCGAWMDDD